MRRHGELLAAHIHNACSSTTHQQMRIVGICSGHVWWWLCTCLGRPTGQLPVAPLACVEPLTGRGLGTRGRGSAAMVGGCNMRGQPDVACGFCVRPASACRRGLPSNRGAAAEWLYARTLHLHAAQAAKLIASLPVQCSRQLWLHTGQGLVTLLHVCMQGGRLPACRYLLVLGTCDQPLSVISSFALVANVEGGGHVHGHHDGCPRVLVVDAGTLMNSWNAAKHGLFHSHVACGCICMETA